MLGLIGGTGLSSIAQLDVERVHALHTPYGETSTPIEEGSIFGQSIFFLHRHGGSGKPIPPHLVNYRANIWAMRELGVRRILAINAVGAINPRCQSGRLFLPRQLIDYTWGRKHTFDDGACGSLMHVDFTQPFTDSLRQEVLGCDSSCALVDASETVLGVVQGPRLETAAEIRRFARDGCDLIGMTSMPEAALAREAGLDYQPICMVVNSAAGVDGDSIDHADIKAVLERETALLVRLLEAYLQTQV
ncbi:MAG: S-methyl-5'-thioinosine phosphorylase [Pseudomonadota bacterium]